MAPGSWEDCCVLSPQENFIEASGMLLNTEAFLCCVHIFPHNGLDNYAQHKACFKKRQTNDEEGYDELFLLSILQFIIVEFSI